MLHARDDYNRIQDPKKKIPKDEPVFLLRAQDPLAAGVVRKWADALEQRVGSNDMVQKARAHADLMDAWGDAVRSAFWVTRSPHLVRMAG